jgi:hypothetical protein
MATNEFETPRTAADPSVADLLPSELRIPGVLQDIDEQAPLFALN